MSPTITDWDLYAAAVLPGFAALAGQHPLLVSADGLSREAWAAREAAKYADALLIEKNRSTRK
jgi:hypothetical protein